MKTFLRLLLVASVLYGTGAHWAALQGFAFARMAMAGQKAPCDICHIVEKGTAVTETPLALRPAPSVDMLIVRAADPKAAPTASIPSGARPQSVSSARALPPLPPPKTGLA